MLNVKLSNQPCVICNEKQDTVLAKCKEHDFQAIVCTKHMLALLKKWDENRPPDTTEAKKPA